jgi:hypothetical protein
MSRTSDPVGQPEYFTRYKNFALSRSASGVLTLRFHTDGGPHVFDGTTHHDLPRLLEDIAFDSANRVLVLTGTGDSFIPSIDGPSLGDLTKPMGFDVMYTEGRRGVQRLVDLEIPIVAAEQMTQRAQLTNKYMAVVFRQRISRRLAEGMLTGMALEGVTAANLAYLQQA